MKILVEDRVNLIILVWNLLSILDWLSEKKFYFDHFVIKSLSETFIKTSVTLMYAASCNLSCLNLRNTLRIQRLNICNFFDLYCFTYIKTAIVIAIFLHLVLKSTLKCFTLRLKARKITKMLTIWLSFPRYLFKLPVLL